jgi:hypothetical protein
MKRSKSTPITNENHIRSTQEKMFQFRRYNTMPFTYYTPKPSKSNYFADITIKNVDCKLKGSKKTMQIKTNSELYLNLANKVETRAHSNLSVNNVNEMQEKFGKGWSKYPPCKDTVKSHLTISSKNTSSSLNYNVKSDTKNANPHDGAELRDQIQRLKSRLLVVETENMFLKTTLEKQYCEFTYNMHDDDDILLNHQTISNHDFDI